jgi:hypothetical protein
LLEGFSQQLIGSLQCLDLLIVELVAHEAENTRDLPEMERPISI